MNTFRCLLCGERGIPQESTLMRAGVRGHRSVYRCLGDMEPEQTVAPLRGPSFLTRLARAAMNIARRVP